MEAVKCIAVLGLFTAAIVFELKRLEKAIAELDKSVGLDQNEETNHN